MPSTSLFQTALEGVLVTQITAAATTATVKVKEINGAIPTWLTGAHRVTFIQKSRTVTKVEVVDVTSASQTGSTVTLTIATRGLPLDGTGFTGTGTAQVFTSGAKVIISWDAQAGRQTVFKDAVNTFTGSGAIRSNSTTTPVVRVNSVTTTQRNAISAANGDMVYDTDLSQFYKYEAGAWAAIDTGTFSNAADNTAGKVDLATAAEVSAGTANDGTSGAPNVIPVAIVKKTAAGAVEGTVPALNSSVALDPSIGGTGRVTLTANSLLAGNGTTAVNLIAPGAAGTVLKSNGTSASFTTPEWNSVNVSTADSTAVGATSTAENSMDSNYVIPTADFVVGARYRLKAAGLFAIVSGNLTLRVKIGTVNIGVSAAYATTGSDRGFVIDAEFTVRTLGASGSVMPETEFRIGNTSNTAMYVDVPTAAITINTTADRTLQVSAQFSASDNGHLCKLTKFDVDRITTA